MPNLDAVLNTLRTHEAELRHRAVKHAAVFGSLVRGDARPDSDMSLSQIPLEVGSGGHGHFTTPPPVGRQSSIH